MVSIPYTTQNVSLFTEPLAVALATTTSGAEIRYTLDGSEPTETSALYAAPVPVDRSLTLKAKGFKPGAAPSRTLTLEAEEAVFRRGMPAETATRPGVAYSYYEGVFSCVNDIRKGKYVSSGTMPAPSIAQAPQEDHFAYVFTGLILIPERGVWEFMTKSDDGSVLMIGDRRVWTTTGPTLRSCDRTRGARSGTAPLHAALFRGLRRTGPRVGLESARSGGLRSDTRSEPAHDGFQGN